MIANFGPGLAYSLSGDVTLGTVLSTVPSDYLLLGRLRRDRRIVLLLGVFLVLRAISPQSSCCAIA